MRGKIVVRQWPEEYSTTKPHSAIKIMTAGAFSTTHRQALKPAAGYKSTFASEADKNQGGWPVFQRSFVVLRLLLWDIIGFIY